jgi:hypothetical protein
MSLKEIQAKIEERKRIENEIINKNLQWDKSDKEFRDAYCDYAGGSAGGNVSLGIRNDGGYVNKVYKMSFDEWLKNDCPEQ